MKFIKNILVICILLFLLVVRLACRSFQSHLERKNDLPDSPSGQTTSTVANVRISETP